MTERELILYGMYYYLGNDEPRDEMAIVLQLTPLVNYAMILAAGENLIIPRAQKISSLINPIVLGELINVLEASEVRKAMLRGGWDSKVVSEEIT